MSKRGMYWRVFAGLALAVASATAQTDLPLEVPAIINTYRADPSSAGSLTIGSYTLTPRAVRELYYESFVAGYMQGEPTGTTLYGLPAGPADYGLAGSLVPADSYPILGRTLRPDERMPRMPLVRSPGPDGLYGPQPGPDGLSNTSDDVYDDQLLLHVRIEKLPTTAECQEVVNHMMRTGLLPGDPDDGTIDAGVDAQATGRWRLIIHPPRTKGAPPAPSLYFPEAIQAVTPATAAADLPTVLDDAETANDRNPYALFWGGLRVRWRQWDEWVRGAWDDAADVEEDADEDFGQEAQPFFLPYPRFLPVDSATKVDHTNPAHRANFQAATTDPHNQFFDPAAMWENRQLNPHYSPDSGDLTNDPEVVRLPHEVGHLEFEADRPERALSETAHARPLEYLLGAAETGWWLQGVHTSGPAESSQAGDPEYLDPAGRPGNTVPIDLTINLMDGRYWANGAWHGVARPQPVAPGVGMVELQFEYETAVAGRDDSDLDVEWSDNDFGNDNAYDTTPDTEANEPPNPQQDQWYEEAKDAVCANANNPTDAELAEIKREWDPRGEDGLGGTADDNPLRRNLLTYSLATVADARGSDGTFDAADEDLLLRDPVNELRTEDRDATAVWRIRRFSGWPFNPLVAGHTTAAGHRYQGGPVTCRFVVSAIQALPEDQQAESADAPALGQMATYDTANGRRYPQPDALPANYGVAGGPVLSDLLERATYLLGYRADIPAATPLAGPGEDYFFPIRPGSSSEAHRFFVQSVMEQTPGGLHLMWTDPANVDPANHATDPAAEEYAEDGYPLRGPGDVTEAWEEADADETVETPPQFVAYRLGDGSGTPPAGYTNNLPNAGPDRMLHAYAVGLWLNSAEVTTERDDRGVQAGDLGRWDVRRAFDGDPRVATPAAGTPPLVSVPENYTVGTLFESETYIDRIEVYWHHTDAVAEAAGDWVLELATQLESTGDVDWTTAGGMVQSALPNLTAYGDNVYSWVVPSSNLRYVAVRVRSEYAAAELVLDELRVVTRADLRKTVSRSIESPLASQDTAIVTTPLADAGVQVSEVLDREITPRGDNTTDAELRVQVPRFQPPSRDAVERQVRVDRGTAPATHTTEALPRPARPGMAGLWDRYRGQVSLFLDDSRTTAPTPASAQALANPRPRDWDAALYRVRYRAAAELPDAVDRPGIYQFVSWYEEDSGWVYAGRDWSGPTDYRYVSDDGSAVIAARLEQVAASQQRVAVEPYTTFDVELSVAYDRRLSIAEKLVDFGKVVHGGISQWVPVTLINEGNVPLRDVRFWVEKPLRPIDTEDRVSDARMAQMQPVPAWFLQNLALGFGNEDSPAQSSGVVGTNDDGVLGTADDDDIGPAPVGSPQGRTVSEVYLRVGRLDPSDPTQDRRVPIGQPFGNYSGQIRVFVDNLGLADDTDVATDTGANADRPDAAETVFGGSATMKLTVQESPLWRIDDFYDNDTSRRSRLSSGGINNLEPYNANTGVGTYQPIPAFKRWDSSLTPASDGIYSDPDAADTTPAIAVVQDPAEFTATPPNVNDRLWVGWSSLRSLTGGVNWGVYFRDATRPTFSSGNILQTNYRSFRWPTDGSGGAGLASNSNGGNERNLYPNVCLMPGSTGADPEYLLLWHSEQEASASARRASYLQFKRYQSGTFTNTLQIPDDVSGGSASSTLNKQVPRAFVNRVDSTDVLWVAWQTGESGQTRLGFNAIAMPAFSGSDDGTGYVDAIGAQGRTFNNYALRTPPGLLNVMEPYVLPSARHEATNMPSAAGALRAVNVLYSGWSPLWRNQDIYWSRYRPIEDETLSSTDPIATRADGLRYSPMAEDAYRLGRLTPTPALGFPTYYVRSLPGGRLPFPRITNELLQTNSNHTVYAASAIDWVMPPDQPRVSGETSTGGWSVERLAHRGFADTDRPLFDSDRYATLAAGTRSADLDPLVVLRVYRAGSLNGQPISSAAAANSANAGRVDFDLEQAYWDESEGEWVLPIATQSDVGGAVEGSNLLLNLGVSVVRVHPGLGRVTFNKPLYRRGATNPVYVYASFRPCAWRLTTDPAVDAQPTAAFDWWERMAIVWRRSDEGGQGQLWYRTFSLAVPLAKAPVTRLEAVVNNADADPAEATKSYDGTVPGSSNPDYARIGQWSFVGRNGGRLQAGDGAWSRIAVASTTQGFALTAFDSRVAVTTDAAQGDTLTGQLAAGMVHFGFDDIGRTVRVWYRSPADLDTSGAERLQEEAFRVPGLGPERLVPIDGAVNESQPAIAAEHSLVGYQLSGATERIMSSRYWLAWVSTRDLFVPDATDPAANPPRLGRAGTNIFYGAFMPEFSPATVAR